MSADILDLKTERLRRLFGLGKDSELFKNQFRDFATFISRVKGQIDSFPCYVVEDFTDVFMIKEEQFFVLVKDKACERLIFIASLKDQRITIDFFGDGEYSLYQHKEGEEDIKAIKNMPIKVMDEMAVNCLVSG